MAASISQLLGLLRQHRWLAAVACGAVAFDFGYYALHNTVGSMRAFRRSCTKEGTQEMLPAPDSLQRSLREAADSLGLERRRLARLVAFTCRGHDPVTLGRLSDSLDAYVGLPEFFDYSAEASQRQQRQAFYFMDRLLSLSTKRGRQLYEECLLLSNEERLFVLARELAYLDSGVVHVVPAVTTVGAAGFMYTMYWLASDKGQMLLDQLAKSGTTRRRIFSALGIIVSAVLWSFMAHQWYAAYCKSLDAKADARAAEAYPNGAVTFYQKMIRRNVLLRAMLGEDVGGKYFTVKGNEVHNKLLSDPFLPVNQRGSKLSHAMRMREQAA